MFEWDIFLSYGWSDNAADEGDRAWVAELLERLSVALRTPTSRGRLSSEVILGLDSVETAR